MNNAGYLVVEPDRGGAAVMKWAAASAIRDRVRLVTLDGQKDVSSLHIADPERFRERLQAAIDAAVPLAEQLDAADAERRNAQERAEDMLLFRVYTAEELKTLPPLQFDVENIIPENAFGTIIGKPGTMKSFLALDIALSQATGHSWHGKEVTQRRVLYIAAEGKAGMGQRIAAWETAHHAVVGDGFFLIADAPQLLNETHVAAVIATGKQYGVSTVYLDTLARTMGGEENNTRDMTQYVAAVDRIMRALGGSGIVVHHMGWNGEHGRGNSALFGAADFELTVTKDGESVAMKVTKAKDFPDGEIVTFAPRVIHLDTGGSSIALDTAASGPHDISATERRVAKMLLETFGAEGATATQWKTICVAAGMDDATFYRAKKELTQAGHLNVPPNEKAKRGWHFSLTEAFTLTLTSLSDHSHERDAHLLSHSHSPYRGECDESEGEGGRFTPPPRRSLSPVPDNEEARKEAALKANVPSRAAALRILEKTKGGAE